MAQFEPQRKLIYDFNDGEKYNDGDGLQAKTVNDLIESALYAQDHIGGGSGGGGGYRHCIQIKGGDFQFEIFDDQEEPYTNETLYNKYLNKTFPCTGAVGDPLNLPSDNIIIDIAREVKLIENISDDKPTGQLAFRVNILQQVFSNGTIKYVTETSYKSTNDCLDTVYELPIGNVSSVALTNYDGDSMEEGFTQYYIKGGAQAKNYYNLGALDTYTQLNEENVTVKRQTGYMRLDGNETWIYDTFNGWFICSSFETKISTTMTSEVADDTVVNNWGYRQQAELANTPDKMIIVRNSGNIYVIDYELSGNVDDLLKKLRKTPLLLQYKLNETYSYEEMFTVNTPVNITSSLEREWVKSEYEKTLNLFNKPLKLYNCTYYESKGLVYQVTADTANSPSWKIQFYKDGSFVSEPVNGKVVVGRCGGAFYLPADINEIRFGVNGSKLDTIVAVDVSNLTEGLYSLYWYFKSITQGTIQWDRIMLTKGDFPYYYQPYHGKILHEEDFIPFKEEIEEKLKDLGFKEGSFDIAFGTATQNTIKRQGNYCIADLKITTSASSIQTGQLLATLPSDFIPQQPVYFSGYCKTAGVGISHYDVMAITFEINTLGQLSLYKKEWSYQFSHTGSEWDGEIVAIGIGYSIK